MIYLYKKRGETPLQALNKLRLTHSELAQETLSYAGRLDPMAEGVIPILVGKEENQNRKEYLQKDKEYEATFLLGCSTDTYDVLGIITKNNFERIEKEKIVVVVENFIKIKQQTYPWYSSKTVNGIPLFEYARLKNFEIERPVREVEIYSVSNIKVDEIDGVKTIQQNVIDIQSVEGNFRQKESIDSWSALSNFIPEKVQTVTCTIKVSSGTYIRSLTEVLEAELGLPVILERLVRTKVF